MIVFHVWGWGIYGEICKFCAILYGSFEIEDLIPRGDPDNSLDWIGELKLPAGQMFHSHIQQPVLVTIIEMVQDGEKRRELAVRPVVWLQSFDSCLCSITETGNSMPLLIELAKTIENRELQTLWFWRRIGAAVADCERIDEVIEAAPQVMGTVASHERPFIKRRRITNVDDKAVAATLSVTLVGDDVRCAIAPGNQFAIEGVEMFFGAAKFEPTTRKFRTSHAVDDMRRETGASKE